MSGLSDSDTGWRFAALYLAFLALAATAHAHAMIVSCVAQTLGANSPMNRWNQRMSNANFLDWQMSRSSSPRSRCCQCSSSPGSSKT